jgi:beta-lactamase regulating signal transducer with metallopeptidase domain
MARRTAARVRRAVIRYEQRDPMPPLLVPLTVATLALSSPPTRAMTMSDNAASTTISAPSSVQARDGDPATGAPEQTGIPGIAAIAVLLGLGLSGPIARVAFRWTRRLRHGRGAQRGLPPGLRQ